MNCSTKHMDFPPGSGQLPQHWAHDGTSLGRQPIFISPGDHLELDHIHTPSEELLLYKLIKNLSHGSSASVEMVEDVNTTLVYARKIFRNMNARTIKEGKL